MEEQREPGTGRGGEWGEEWGGGGVGAERRRRGWRSADWSLPSQEGLPAATDSPGPPAAPGSPWPPGWAAAPASWLSSPAAALALTSLPALQTRGPSLGRDRKSQAPSALRTGGRERGRDAVGGGERREEKRSGTGEAPPSRIPPSATADPLTPHSPRPHTPKRPEPWRPDRPHQVAS